MTINQIKTMKTSIQCLDSIRIRLALACIAAWTLVSSGRAMSPLAEQFPPAKLAQVLLPASDWRPFPACTDRTAWESLPANVKAHLIRRGEQALTNVFPPLPATLYLEYARVGNRSHFQKHYFDRREMLCALVLAECVEGKGRFLDAAANSLWAIITRTTVTPRKDGLFGFNPGCDFKTITIRDNVIESHGQARPLLRCGESYGAVIRNNRLTNLSDMAR